VLAAEHLPRLGALDFLLEFIERAPEFRGHIFTRARPLEQDADVVSPTPE